MLIICWLPLNQWHIYSPSHRHLLCASWDIYTWYYLFCASCGGVGGGRVGQEFWFIISLRLLWVSELNTPATVQETFKSQAHSDLNWSEIVGFRKQNTHPSCKYNLSAWLRVSSAATVLITTMQILHLSSPAEIYFYKSNCLFLHLFCLMTNNAL